MISSSSSCRAVGAVRVGCLVALLVGCALTSKGEALTPRYFTPLLEPDAASQTAPRAPSARPATKSETARSNAELRLGMVAPAAHLEQRIAYRVSDTELAYYDDRRWSEPPEELVRRALERELFERRGLSRILSGAAPTLDVDVVGFEELREQPARARVSLRVTLHDERRSQLERSITVDVPVAAGADAGPALARAMAGALSAAIQQVADATVSELGAERDSVARH
jgi:cholesterol transport system auxiliary component